MSQEHTSISICYRTWRFGDEKSLKGQELFLRMTGFCGIDYRSVPVWYKIRKETNDAEQFRRDI